MKIKESLKLMTENTVIIRFNNSSLQEVKQ